MMRKPTQFLYKLVRALGLYILLRQTQDLILAFYQSIVLIFKAGNLLKYNRSYISKKEKLLTFKPINSIFFKAFMD